MKEHTREEPRIVAAAERQMRRWSLSQELAGQIAEGRRVDPAHPQLGEYITLSREAGAGGSEIAQRIGQCLGWEVLDRDLVDRVADRVHLSRPMLDVVDETASNWAYDIFGPWIDKRIITHEKYVVHLSRVVLAAARRGCVVLVGRGAQFLLPSDQGMAVRIVASEKFRLDRLMRRFGCGESEARRIMERIDRDRREFVLRYFHHDMNDPHLFDLIVQTDRLGPAAAAELIVDAYRRFARGRE